MRQIFTDSIKNKKCVEIFYHGFSRIVEVHTFGNNTLGHDAIRAWQVSGGSVRNEPIGWKMFLLSDMRGAQLLNQEALSPRSGYKKGDRGMRIIYCEV